MLLVVGGIKGGSGKTTLATNLCQMRAEAGKKVLLVDADDQKSSYDWYHEREVSRQREILNVASNFSCICLSGTLIYKTLEKMRPDYDDIIVDTGGRDTVSQRSSLCAADVFLIPFKPRSLDIWTMGAVRSLIRDCSITNPKLQSIVVITQADSIGKDNIDALEIMKEFEEVRCLDHFIGYRKAFGNAAANGLGVAEVSPRDPKAILEMQQLYAEIYQNDMSETVYAYADAFGKLSQS